MAETDVASVVTPSVSTAVTYTIGAASEVDASAQVFNPLTGYWISDPIVLPGTPVTGSVVRWTATTPAAGSTVTVQTSINNGASWDTAINNGAIPRLSPGNTVTQQVLVKVTLTRVLGSDTTPRVTSLEVRVACDASVDELIPVAYGMITQVEATSSGGSGMGSGSSSGGAGITGHGGGQYGGAASIKVSGVDPSRTISRNVWQQPYIVPSGLTYDQAAVAMVLDRLPGQVDFSITSVPEVVPLLVYGMTQGSDPWQDIQDLAAAVGCECYFDPTGTFVFRPVPDPRRGSVVWTFDDTVNPVVVHSRRQLTDEQTFNYVVVMGEATSTANPVAAIAYDNDPSSPTYVFGAYGIVVEFVTMPQIITADQAQRAANAILAASLGASDTVTLSGVPFPPLEPGDLVRVISTDVKASGVYMVNQVTTPLSPASGQELTCFRQSQQLQ
jgi:hypothetical protein